MKPDETVEIYNVPTSRVDTTGRARVDMGGIDELAESIRRNGLLQPIVVNRLYQLLCGGRRLEAIKRLKWATIPAIFLDDLSPAERLEVELEENTRRKDLAWQEELGLRGRVVEAWTAQKPGMTLATIAERLGVHPNRLDYDGIIRRAATRHPDIMQEPDISSAYRKAAMLRDHDLRRLMVEASHAPFADVITHEQPDAGIHNTEIPSYTDALVTLHNIDCLKGLWQLPPASVDVIVTDPPFGIDYDQTKAGVTWDEVYEDTYEAIFVELLPPVLAQLARVLKPDGHFYFMYPMLHHQKMIDLVTAAGLSPQPFPLIWDKGFNYANQKYYTLDYEPILFGGKVGRRALNTPARCLIKDHPRVQPANKIHPVQRPVSLFRYLIEQSTIPGEVVLDPFAGSGATLVAARQSGRRAVGYELSERWYLVARERLERMTDEVSL